MFKSLAVVLVISFCAVSAHAAVVLVDFDDPSFNDGDALTDQYQSIGVVFETLAPDTVVVNILPDARVISAPDSVYFFKAVTLAPPVTFTARFVLPNTFTQAFTDFVAFTPTDASQNNTLFSMTAYDINGLQLDQVFENVESTGVYNPIEDPEKFISRPTSDIAYVVLSATVNSGNLAVEGDNLRFNTPVPEPTTLTLLGPVTMLLFSHRRA